MQFYRNIFKKAWYITWRNKYLWFFGIFATLLGAGGEYDFIFSYYNATGEEGLFPGLRDLASTGLFRLETIPNIGKAIIADPIAFTILLLVLLIVAALVCFLAWVVIISQVGIVNASGKIIGEKNTDIKEGIDTGIKKFWPVFFMTLIQKAAIGILVMILTIFLLNSSLALIFQLLFVIFLIISLFIAFLFKYAIFYSVIRGLKFDASIKESWKLLKKNWLITVEMAFLIFVISIIAGILAILALVTLAAPLAFFAIIAFNLKFMAGFWVIAFVSAILFLTILIIAGTLMTVFQVSSWTILFTDLIGAGGKSKLVRIFSKT